VHGAFSAGHGVAFDALPRRARARFPYGFGRARQDAAEEKPRRERAGKEQGGLAARETLDFGQQLLDIARTDGLGELRHLCRRLVCVPRCGRLFFALELIGRFAQRFRQALDRGGGAIVVGWRR